MKLQGRVVRGAGMGRKLGFPTANLDISAPKDLRSGIHFTEVWRGKQKFNGLLHCGPRETLDLASSVEVHILDFDEDIYGESLFVNVLKFHRPSVKYPSTTELITAIKIDEIKGRKFFCRREMFQHWQDLSSAKIEKMKTQALEQIAALPKFKKAKNIYIYAPIKYEIPFVSVLMNRFPEKSYYFPKIITQTPIPEIAFFPSSWEALSPSSQGFLEPKAQASVFRTPDLIFVPAVAVDRDLYRLGRGGGYYDVFLDQTPGYKLTVIPDFVFIDTIPTEPHDKKIDEVLDIRC